MHRVRCGCGREHVAAAPAQAGTPNPRSPIPIGALDSQNLPRASCPRAGTVLPRHIV
jgi:hypothetical protein